MHAWHARKTAASTRTCTVDWCQQQWCACLVHEMGEAAVLEEGIDVPCGRGYGNVILRPNPAARAATATGASTGSVATATGTGRGVLGRAGANDCWGAVVLCCGREDEGEPQVVAAAHGRGWPHVSAARCRSDSIEVTIRVAIVPGRGRGFTYY